MHFLLVKLHSSFILTHLQSCMCIHIHVSAYMYSQGKAFRHNGINVFIFPFTNISNPVSIECLFYSVFSFSIVTAEPVNQNSCKRCWHFLLTSTNLSGYRIPHPTVNGMSTHIKNLHFFLEVSSFVNTAGSCWNYSTRLQSPKQSNLQTLSELAVRSCKKFRLNIKKTLL